MAAFQLAPPEQFNFTQPDEWPKWIRRFERLREASGLDRKAQSNQVNTLLYSMGDKADDILCSLNLTVDEKRSYETVKTKLDTSLNAETQSLNVPSSIRDGKRGAKVSIFSSPHYIALQNIATMGPFETR